MAVREHMCVCVYVYMGWTHWDRGMYTDIH